MNKIWLQFREEPLGPSLLSWNVEPFEDAEEWVLKSSTVDSSISLAKFMEETDRVYEENEKLREKVALMKEEISSLYWEYCEEV